VIEVTLSVAGIFRALTALPPVRSLAEIDYDVVREKLQLFRSISKFPPQVIHAVLIKDVSNPAKDTTAPSMVCLRRCVALNHSF